jgi:hypothetical protein
VKEENVMQILIKKREGKGGGGDISAGRNIILSGI